MKLTTKRLKQLIKEELRKITEALENRPVHIQGIENKIDRLEKEIEKQENKKEEIEDDIEDVRRRFGDDEARSAEEMSDLYEINALISKLEDKVKLLRDQLEALKNNTKLGDYNELPRGKGPGNYWQ
jgi:chromosome segregation ATPase